MWGVGVFRDLQLDLETAGFGVRVGHNTTIIWYIRGILGR